MPFTRQRPNFTNVLEYNLLKREEERETLAMCADMGVGCIPYSPQGKGRPTQLLGQQSQRYENDTVAKTFDLDVDRPVVEAVLTLWPAPPFDLRLSTYHRIINGGRPPPLAGSVPP